MSNPDNAILKVRRSIHIAAPPARVWQEFADKPRMDGWWGKVVGKAAAGQPSGQHLIAYEPGRGGRIEMEVDRDGAPDRYGGAIEVFDPARELTFQNDWIPGWKAPTYITLRLTPVLNGTMVELFHHGFERTGPAGAADHAGYEQGWGMLQLNSLKAVVETD